MGKMAALRVILFMALLTAGSVALLAACGSDEAAPADPAATSVIPDTVFFNTFDPDPRVLFEGRAMDNFRVETVLISFDNGAVWHTADIDSSPPNTVRNVAWSYPAAPSDMAPAGTVLIRAVDGEDNQSTSAPIPVTKQTGNTTGDLLALFSSATAGDILALSSGVGGAYGDSLAALTIPVTVDLTVLGSGYGSTATNGGVTFPAVASTATVLEASPATARLISVTADLSLRKVRVKGAQRGIAFSDPGGDDPLLSVQQCLFDRQGAWAVHAADGDGAARVEFMDSVADASFADSTHRGGLYLGNVRYRVEGSEFYFMTDPGGPADTAVTGAAVQMAAGAGTVTDSLFEDNALALWASGSEAVITSNVISGAAFTTYGINLAGAPATPLVRRNSILDNSGYGVRIGGSSTPVFYRNVIRFNMGAGIVIDFTGPSGSVDDITLGDTLDFDTGFNDIYDNEHPIQAGDTEVYVTTATTFSVVPVPAANNYWGVASQALINARIYDNKRTPANDRAIVNPVPFHISPQN